MDDLIRRSDAIRALIEWYGCKPNDIEAFEKINENIPSADRPQGEWKPFDLKWGRSIWYCTACEEGTEVPCDIWEHKPIYKFCPNCGARMTDKDIDVPYKIASEQRDYDSTYEPTYNEQDGSM